MQILHVDSSILADNSISRQLTKKVVERLMSNYSDATVQYRDLERQPVGFLTGQHLAGASDDVQINNDLQDASQILASTIASDIIVIGAPMYNLTIPSQLKSWLDRLCVAGVTFKYTGEGPIGLLKNKKVFIISSRGGFASENGEDHQEGYLKQLLNFIGITDITFIRVQGTNISAEQRQAALAQAKDEIALIA